MTEVFRNSVLVSESGGTLDMVSRDGEVLVSVHVPPGAHDARLFVDLLPYGAVLQVRDGLVAMRPRRHRIGILPYGPGFTASGANPDFRPTSASRLEREMRVTLNRMKAAASRVEKRERALAQIERVPKAPREIPQDDLQVIEPEAKPEVEPEANLE